MSSSKLEVCGQKVLPDRSILIGQKLVENAKISNATFWVDKNSLKMPKMVIFDEIWKHEACGQTVLPDRSHFIWEKLWKRPKLKNQMRLF